MDEKYEVVKQAAAALEAALNALPHRQNVEVTVKHPKIEEYRSIAGNLLGCASDEFSITVVARPQPRRIYP